MPPPNASSPITDPSDQYNMLLFSMVHQFSNIEAGTRMLLREKTGLSQTYFDILFGLPQLGSTISKLIKLFELDPHPAQQTLLLEALTKARDISRLRNWMVHAGGHPSGDDKMLVRLNPNERSVSTGASYHIFETAELSAAIGDLVSATAILYHVLYPETITQDVLRPRKWRFTLPGIEKA